MLTQAYISTRLLTKEEWSYFITIFSIFDKFERGVLSEHDIWDALNVFYQKKLS